MYYLIMSKEYYFMILFYSINLNINFKINFYCIFTVVKYLK
jgi:hypothetical protein